MHLQNQITVCIVEAPLEEVATASMIATRFIVSIEACVMNDWLTILFFQMISM